MGVYSKNASTFKFFSPGTQAGVFGGWVLSLSALFCFMTAKLAEIPLYTVYGWGAVRRLLGMFQDISRTLCACGIALMGAGFLVNHFMSDKAHVRIMVRKGLFCPRYGNPLHLKDGEYLPKVTCRSSGGGDFDLTIAAVSQTTEDLQNISSSISSCLRGRYRRYAVTRSEVDLSFNGVLFHIEDVRADKSLTIHSPKELKADCPTRIPIQEGIDIDLTTSGSILCAGKTRSGKTTGIISILLSALIWGRDNYGSEIILVDPKRAELSRTPHVCTLGKNGEYEGIIDTIRGYADTITRRQQVLDDLSEQKGDAVKWWDAGMHVSFLFIDEYVTCRDLFPKRSTKDNAGYSLADFDGLIKRIVTMGASAGCYVIISIAEASVEEGGLPSMLRNAMSTKILFRPTEPEGRLMWAVERLKDFNKGRYYEPGDAWFSSTDGKHENVVYVHFPRMEFPVYRELGRRLEAYYRKD